MRDFDKALNEEVEAIKQNSKTSDIMRLTHEAHELQSELNSVNEQLQQAVETLNAQLALELRKSMPKLNVNLSNGKCYVRYRSHNSSKSVVVFPDVTRGRWEVEPGDFGRGFAKHFDAALPLQDDLDPLVDAIVEYFSTQYKSLR